VWHRLSFFLSVIFISCEQDESIVEPAEEEVAPDYEAISSARDWFFTQTGGDVLLEVQSQTKSTGNSTIQHPLLGAWESGLTTRIDNIKNVEVPVYSVDSEEAYSEALNGTGSLKSGKIDTDDENMPSRTRFVVQNDEATSTTRGFMMTVMPDEDYLASGGSIDSMDYYNRGTDFSGLIVFHHLDGSFANAWEYNDGDIIDGYIPRKEEKTDNLLKALVLMKYTMCSMVKVEWKNYISYNERCWDSYGYVYHFDQIQGNYAPSNFEVRVQLSGGGSSNGGSSSSGVKKGVYLPYNTPKTPLTDNIISRSTLDSKQTILLENALDELIGVCSDEYIYNELVAQGKKFNFEMDSSLGGFAGYDPASKTFSFLNNDAISSGKLKEEFFHAFQDAFYPGGTSQYGTTGKVNIEFEAKLYRDITAANCCMAFYESSAPQAVLEQYTRWVQSLQVNPSSITSKDYQKWLKLFNQYTNSYSSPFSSALSYPHALDHIINMSNCF
jgi:hypothetical protein